MGSYDVAVISKPNHFRTQGADWKTDKGKDAVLWLSMRKRFEVRRKGRGYAWADLGGAVVHGCYKSPNSTLVEYEAFFEELEARCGARGDCLSSRETSTQRQEDKAARAEEVRRNGRKFRRNGRKSFLGFTMYTGGMENPIGSWRVLDTKTLSDHVYITYEITTGGRTETGAVISRSTWRWNPRKIDLNILRDFFRLGSNRGPQAPTPDHVQ